MRVLMVAPTPFFSDRGCHIRIFEEVEGLTKLGHIIRVCTYGLGKDVPGVDIVRTKNFPWYKKISAGPSKTKILLLPLLWITTMREIRRFNPDIIHAHLHEGACIARACRLFYPRKKYVFDMQGGLTREVLQHGFVKENGIGRLFINRIEHAIIKWQYIIISSKHMEEDLRLLGCDKNNYENVMDGVNIDFFVPQETDYALLAELGKDRYSFRVVFVGMLEEYQGVDLLLEAFGIVVKQIPNALLLLYGYPNEEYYMRKCMDLEIENNVVITGRVDYLSLPRYLSLGNIAVAPKISVTEGNGKIYNYMAMGLATIAFDTVTNREIMDNAGIYVDEVTSEALADKIIWSFNNMEECMKIGLCARDRAVKSLSNVEMAMKIERVYRDLIKGEIK